MSVFLILTDSVHKRAKLVSLGHAQNPPIYAAMAFVIVTIGHHSATPPSLELLSVVDVVDIKRAWRGGLLPLASY